MRNAAACAPAVAALLSSTLVLFTYGCSEARLEGREQQHPSLVLPHHIAEGDTGKPEAAPAVPAPEPEPDYGSQPDPEPLLQAEQLEYTVVYSRGELSVSSAKRRTLSSPRLTPRMMGRFAFELWIGGELLERVRFDFPLLGAEDGAKPPGTYGEPINLEAGLETSQVLFVPEVTRATKARIVDRKTGETLDLEWPVPASAVKQGPKTGE